MHACTLLASQLSLWTCRFDGPEIELYADHPDKKRVETLWRMPLEQRLRLWEGLGRRDSALENVQLGGSVLGRSCPLGDAELSLLLPGRLDSLRVLFLSTMSKLTDTSIQALAEAGCGANLTSLTLWGENKFSLSPFVVLSLVLCLPL